MEFEAYTDGSYKESKDKRFRIYGSASIYREVNTSDWSVLKACGNDESIINQRNVAGELLAVMQLCMYLINLKDDQNNPVQIDKLTINYDYDGVKKWVTMEWQAKNPFTQKYRDYMRTIAVPTLHIVFQHTKGHTGIAGNELVDTIAHTIVDEELQKLIDEE